LKRRICSLRLYGSLSRLRLSPFFFRRGSTGRIQALFSVVSASWSLIRLHVGSRLHRLISMAYPPSNYCLPDGEQKLLDTRKTKARSNAARAYQTAKLKVVPSYGLGLRPATPSFAAKRRSRSRSRCNAMMISSTCQSKLRGSLLSLVIVSVLGRRRAP